MLGVKGKTNFDMNVSAKSLIDNCLLGKIISHRWTERLQKYSFPREQSESIWPESIWPLAFVCLLWGAIHLSNLIWEFLLVIDIGNID
jgi:hypothetical protein